MLFSELKVWFLGGALSSLLLFTSQSFDRNLQRFPSLGLYLKFTLFRIPAHTRFGTDRFHCSLFLILQSRIVKFYLMLLKIQKLWLIILRHTHIKR
jgi:hypothetical protein